MHGCLPTVKLCVTYYILLFSVLWPRVLHQKWNTYLQKRDLFVNIIWLTTQTFKNLGYKWRNLQSLSHYKKGNQLVETVNVTLAQLIYLSAYSANIYLQWWQQLNILDFMSFQEYAVSQIQSHKNHITTNNCYYYYRKHHNHKRWQTPKYQRQIKLNFIVIHSRFNIAPYCLILVKKRNYKK